MAVIMQQLAKVSSDFANDASAFEAQISALKSCISALESSINASEGASRFWERFGWSCAIAVGVGIVGELVVIVREYLDDLESWARGIVRPPDRPSFRLFWFDIFATVLVLAGVFGEAGASGKIASLNNDLRSNTSLLRAKSDQLLALATQEAGNAEERAANANRIAQEERLATVQLEARVNPRRLTVDEQKAIGQACKDLYLYGTSKRIEIGSYGMDPEGATLADQIVAALGSAPLYMTGSIGTTFKAGVVDSGVFISAAPEDEKFADCLKSALTNIGKLTGVQVNAARHRGNAIFAGSGGAMFAGDELSLAQPLSSGSPVRIFVAIKPVEIAGANRQAKSISK